MSMHSLSARFLFKQNLAPSKMFLHNSKTTGDAFDVGNDGKSRNINDIAEFLRDWKLTLFPVAIP